MNYSSARYGRAVIFLHWTIFALVAFAYLAIEIKKFLLPYGHPLRATVQGLHIWAGLLVLSLAVCLLTWRLKSGRPPPESDQNPWITRSASLVHRLLYAFLFVQPLAAILAINAGGHAVQLPWLGIALPPLVTSNDALKSAAWTIHVWTGNAFYVIIGLHIAAAFWHHLIRKDGTLSRMWR
jgi:cytochrome b561